MRSSQPSSQAPASGSSQYFSACRLQKTDNFPPLYVEKNASPHRLNPDSATYWIFDIANWASAHGLHNIFDLCNALVTISADGSQRLPLFPNNPEYENFAQEIEGMRAVMLLVSNTTFGMHHKVNGDQVRAMDEQSVRHLFTEFSQVASALYFRLSQAAKSPKTPLIPSIMPEVFANSNPIMKMDGVRHPLSGFVALQQIVNIFNRNPQGTALQMKRNLIKMIDATPQDSTFSMFKINQLLQDVDLKMANINMKDPDGKKALDKEVVQTIFEALRQVCRNTTKDSRNSSALLNVAEFTGHNLMQWSRDETMEWYSLHSQLSFMLSRDLPTEDVKEGKRKADNSSLALAAKHQKGKPQAKQGSSSAQQGATSNAAWLINWTCSKCGLKGHLPKNCTNPPNPNAAQLVEQAKREAADRRLENDKLRMQRKRINDANDALAAEDDNAPSTVKKPRLDAASTQNKKDAREVKANFSRHGGGMTVSVPNHPIAVDSSDDEDDYDARHHTVHMAICVAREDLAMPVDACCAPVIDTNPALLNRLHFPVSLHLPSLVLTICAMAVCAVLALAHEATVTATPISSTLAVAVLALAACFGNLLLGADATAPQHISLGVTSRVPMDQAAVYVDSGCTKSIFGNPFKLVNLRRPDREYYVKGIAGQVRVTEMGDFPLAMRADDGKTHIIVIKNCLVTPEANLNLLATCDLQKAGVSFRTTAHSKNAALELERNNKKIVFDLTFDHGLYKLPFYKDVATHFAGAFSHQLRALTEGELWHRRLGHAGSDKIAKLSQRCKGIGKPLAENDLVCHQCHEAKAKRAKYPPESTN